MHFTLVLCYKGEYYNYSPSTDPNGLAYGCYVNRMLKNQLQITPKKQKNKVEYSDKHCKPALYKNDKEESQTQLPS